MKTASRWGTPNGMMAIVFVMYLCKVVAKLAIGRHVHSPMITGDGWHNVADLIEVVLVVAAVYMARMAPDADYPFGRKNFESIVRASIGAGLLVAALGFAGRSVAGLLALAPDLDRTVRETLPILPTHHPLRMGSDVAGWVIGCTLVSVVLSFVVSRHEIAVGKAHGHPSMVADGEETRGDGMIEGAILIGVCSEYLFRAPWLEYVFGLGIAFLISRTGVELLRGGWNALLQKSLGREVEMAMKKTCCAMHGVADVERITTFAVGSLAVCIIKILTDVPARAQDDLRKILKERLVARLAELGHEESQLHLRFSGTSMKRHRVAYAIVRDGKVQAIARSLEESTHFFICNVERGAVVRSELEKPPTLDPHGVLAWLEKKRVKTVYVFGARDSERRDSVLVMCVPTYNVRAFGIIDS